MTLAELFRKLEAWRRRDAQRWYAVTSPCPNVRDRLWSVEWIEGHDSSVDHIVGRTLSAALRAALRAMGEIKR